MKTVAQIKQMVDEAATMKDLIEKMSKLGWEHANSEPDHELGLAAYDVASKRERVLDAARSIKHTAEQVIRRLEEKTLSYSGLNSLGELQSRGPAFDVEVARYCDAFDRMVAVIQERRELETKIAFNKVLDDVTSIAAKIYVELKKNGSKTAKQVKAQFDFSQEETDAALRELVSDHLVGTGVHRGATIYVANDAFTWESRSREAREKQVETAR
jgi:hypothetical protein